VGTVMMLQNEFKRLISIVEQQHARCRKSFEGRLKSYWIRTSCSKNWSWSPWWL